MKLEIMDQTFEFENSKAHIEKLFDTANRVLADSGLVSSHSVVDGVEVFEDIKAYITDRIESIRVVRIETATQKQLAESIIISSGEYLTRALPITRRLADSFYSQPSQKSWVELEQLLEGIQWIYQMNHTLSGISVEEWSHSFSSPKLDIQELTSNLERALKNKDSVLIADLIQYEITPYFESLNEEVNTIIDNGAVRNDLN